MNLNKGFSSYGYDDVINEIEMQIELSNKGIAPKIYDAFYCKQYFRDWFDKQIITVNSKVDIPFKLCKEEKKDCKILNREVFLIMEKMDITISTFLENLKNVSQDLATKYRKKLESIAFNRIRSAHSLNIVHGDAHVSNFMFNFSEKGKEVFDKIEKKEYNTNQLEKILKNDDDFFGSFSSLKLIDFGKTAKISFDEYKKNRKVSKKEFIDILNVLKKEDENKLEESISGRKK